MFRGRVDDDSGGPAGRGARERGGVPHREIALDQPDLPRRCARSRPGLDDEDRLHGGRPVRRRPGLPQTQTTEHALGSGFVVDKAGHIVTNYHVVAGAGTVFVSFSDNESLRATIVGRDPSSDLAVLQVDAHSRALTPLMFADSDRTRVGDGVVAIGNPFGLDRSVTSGIVSALQRPITAPNGSRSTT